MSNCDPKCPCQNPDAPKYPSGKLFKNKRNESLMIVSKDGKFPDAKYTVLNMSTGRHTEHSYASLVRKETGKNEQ